MTGMDDGWAAVPQDSAAARPATECIGGRPFYGFVAGVLVLDSTTPRPPGDPAHAQTFSFPVTYEVIPDFSIADLREYDPSRLGPVLGAARSLEARGVHFIAADCGLFSLFQKDIAAGLRVPFLGSALVLLPLLQTLLPASLKVGVITGHTAYLSEAHLTAVGADLQRTAVVGMENCREFVRAVINRGPNLDPDAIRWGMLSAAAELRDHEPHIGAWLLECPNLVSFRADLIGVHLLPVFDLIALIEMCAGGLALRRFAPRYPTT